jgi:hypothetical protein
MWIRESSDDTTPAILSQSVVTKTLDIEFAPNNAFSVHQQRGAPQNSLIFLKGMDLEPPLRGTAATKLSLGDETCIGTQDILS